MTITQQLTCCRPLWAIVPLAALALSARGALAAEAAKPAWRYVVPEAGQIMEHAPLRDLPLSDSKPPDLKETARYRGVARRYTEFRFGLPGAKHVAVALDRLASGETDVYVDSNRDRLIEDDERLAGPGPKFCLPLRLEDSQGNEAKEFRRTVVFRLGRGGRSISYATAGYMEGTLQLEGREVSVRRVDGNGDGGMADTADLLWLRPDRDEAWNPFTDRLPMMPILKLGDSRYAVRSDWAGERLSFEKLEGEGELELSLPKERKRGEFLDLSAVVMGREGSIARLDLAHEKVSVPVGEYSLYELSLVVKDPYGGQPWAFFFSRSSESGSPHWYTVNADGRTAVDPLSDFRLTARLDPDETQCEPGIELTVQTRLETADHLRLDACYRSDKADSNARHPGAEIHLVSAAGETLSSAQSGFS